MARMVSLLLAFIVLVAADCAAGPKCSKVVGRIDGILLNGTRVDSPPPAAVNLRRGDDSLQVTNGLPVCALDRISTAGNVTVTVRLGENAESEAQITVYGGSTAELSAPDSILLRIGRLFASLRAPFTAN